MAVLPKPGYRFLSTSEVTLGIPDSLCPMIVLSENFRSWVSRRIVFWSTLRLHKQHQYSHAMELVSPGTLATQAATYHREPLALWVTEYIRLKFWHCNAWTGNDRVYLRAMIDHDLKAPLHRRIYDAPGIVGQWLDSVFGWGSWVNVPGIHFCSARTARHLEPWTPGLERQPSPAGLDRYFSLSGAWTVYGVYDPREEACQ